MQDLALEKAPIVARNAVASRACTEPARDAAIDVGRKGRQASQARGVTKLPQTLKGIRVSGSCGNDRRRTRSRAGLARMLRQYARKKAKIARGFWRTYVHRVGRRHEDTSWWDFCFYVDGVSDERTLSRSKREVVTRYHHTSVELQILRHIANYGIRTNGAVVLDLGSGAGHWIDFYGSLGSAVTTGLDFSRSSVAYLTNKYAGTTDCPSCPARQRRSWRGSTPGSISSTRSE
jgi:hypothetical protein